MFVQLSLPLALPLWSFPLTGAPPRLDCTPVLPPFSPTLFPPTFAPPPFYNTSQAEMDDVPSDVIERPVTTESVKDYGKATLMRKASLKAHHPYDEPEKTQ